MNMDDMWMFNITSLTWNIIISPKPAYSTNYFPSFTTRPPARTQGSTWVDESKGIFWLFGGYINSIERSQCDLWNFNFTAWKNEKRIIWTILSDCELDGPNARHAASTWIIDDSVYIWGGKALST